MSRTYISKSLRQLVEERANYRCEYCLINQDDTVIPHEPDHIIPEQHDGQTIASNLALACADCNRHKGPNLGSIDPISRRLVPLFNPRKHNWHKHFHLDGPYIRPLTPIGRVTVKLLRFNDPERVRIRHLLIEDGRFPQP